MAQRTVLASLLLVFALLPGPPPAMAQEPASIASLLDAYRSGQMETSRAWGQSIGMVQQFYQAAEYRPVWGGNASPLARQALRQLQSAAGHGLAPEDYTVDAAMPERGPVTPAQAARFELALTSAMLRFLHDLHTGRTAPDFTWIEGSPPPRDFDAVSLLHAALRHQQLDEAVAGAQPPHALYRRVQRTLAAYRALEPRFRDLAPLPPLPGGAAVSPGMEYAFAAELRARLALLGDMPDSAGDAGGGTYDEALADGVRRFQMRHGLQQDGVIGKATMAALSVPLAQRIRQLELTLERLRWMPALPPGRIIVINVPSFRLWALDTRAQSDVPPLEMRVIVGKAAQTPTPLFIARLRHVEFHPAWNIPRSIALQEIVPKLVRDPSYLARQDMELVDRGGGVVDGIPSAAALRSGAVRIRQRPGTGNPLGAVKFAMPNPMNIYLHDTPATELFARQRRDFSHGCIRLERPAELAAFVLQDVEGWDLPAILQAMDPGPTKAVPLSAPIPVVLFYATAMTDRQGRALFSDDIYGLDHKLLDALASR